MNRDILKRVLGSVAAFITAVLLFLSALALTFFAVSGRDFLHYTVDSTDYIPSAAAELQESLNAIAGPSGLPENFFAGKIDAELLRDMNRECIDGQYSGAGYSYDTSALHKSYVDYFTEYASGDNIANSDVVNSDAIHSLATDCVNSYSASAVNIIFEYLPLYCGKLHKYALLGGAALLAVAIGGLVYLTKIERKTKGNSYIYFALCSAGIMSAALPAYALLSRTVERLGIHPLSSLNFVVGYAHSAFYIMIAAGAVLIAIALLLKLLPHKE